MLQPLSILSPSLLREVNGQVRKAKLPKRILWPEGVIVTDLYKEWGSEVRGGARRPRSLKGNFRIQHPAMTIVVENKVTAKYVDLFWIKRIDPDNGRVVALPALAGKLELGSYEQLRAENLVSEDTNSLQTELAALLGLLPRELFLVGPLLPLFPKSTMKILSPYGIENLWDTVAHIRRSRQSVISTLTQMTYL